VGATIGLAVVLYGLVMAFGQLSNGLDDEACSPEGTCVSAGRVLTAVVLIVVGGVAYSAYRRPRGPNLMPVMVVLAAVLGGVAFVESGIAAGDSEGSFGKVVIGISMFAAAGVLVFSLVQDPVRTAVFRDGTQVPGGTAGLMSRMVSVRHPRTIGFAGSMGGSASVQVAARGPAVKLRPAQDVMGVPPEIRDALERVVHRYDDTEDLGVGGLNPEGNVRLVDKKPGSQGSAASANQGSAAAESQSLAEVAPESSGPEPSAGLGADGVVDGQPAASPADLVQPDPAPPEPAHSESAHSDLAHSDLAHSDLAHSDLAHSDLAHSDLSPSGVSAANSTQSQVPASDSSALNSKPSNSMPSESVPAASVPPESAQSESRRARRARGESTQSEPTHSEPTHSNTDHHAEEDQLAAFDGQTETDALPELGEPPVAGERQSTVADDQPADSSVADPDEQSSAAVEAPGSAELLGIEVTPFHEPIDLSHRPLDPYPVPPSDTMNLARQLAELAELRRDGALTEDEFIRAKQLVLGVDPETDEAIGADGKAGVVHDIRFRFDDGIGRTGS